MLGRIEVDPVVGGRRRREDHAVVGIGPVDPPLGLGEAPSTAWLTDPQRPAGDPTVTYAELTSGCAAEQQDGARRQRRPVASLVTIRSAPRRVRRGTRSMGEAVSRLARRVAVL